MRGIGELEPSLRFERAPGCPQHRDSSADEDIEFFPRSIEGAQQRDEQVLGGEPVADCGGV